MSDDNSVRDCAARLERDGIEVDVLVNNAGVLESGAILSVDDDLLRHTLEVNLLGPLRTARAFLPGMLDRGYGRVVNVSSGAGSLTEAAAYSPAYSISKAALNMLTRQLAFAAEGHGDVKVNAMCPGWVQHGHGRPVGSPLSGGGRRHAGVAGDPARRRPDERLLQGPATGRLVGALGRPGYLRRQAPPKKRDNRPPARLALNSGAPGSGSGSSAASAASIDSVTRRSAIRETSGASTNRRPRAVVITMPSKMCSRGFSSTRSTLPISSPSEECTAVPRLSSLYETAWPSSMKKA